MYRGENNRTRSPPLGSKIVLSDRGKKKPARKPQWVKRTRQGIWVGIIAQGLTGRNFKNP